MTLALTPAMSPVGPFVDDAQAAACTPTENVVSGEQVLTFTSSTSCTWTPPTGVSKVDYLIVAGGGGGGSTYSGFGEGGGGGGAGGLLAASDEPVSNLSPETIQVGQGGAVNSPGANTVALGYTAWGGGRGGYSDATSTDPNNASAVALWVGGNGGSGGGGHGPYADRAGGSGVSGQGSEGGVGLWVGHRATGEGGGGGGAGGPGGPAGTHPSWTIGFAKPGPGVSSSITGSAITYAHGGPGGNSADYTTAYTTPGSGGKGGPGGAGAGATGGQGGIVVLSYSFTPSAPTSTSVSSGNASITIDFDAPTHWGGGTLSIEYSTDNGSTWRDIGQNTDGPVSVSAESDGDPIENNTFYTVKLRAKNTLGGTSYLSSEVAVGTVIPSAVGEILRFDATHPDSYSGSATSWSDLAGSLDGTLTSGPSYSTREKAFQFDGTDDYVDLPDMAYDFSQGVAIHIVADFGDVADNWERLIDFGNGPAADNIWFGRSGTSENLAFETFSGGTSNGYCATTDGAGIIAGVHTYSVVVSSEGDCSLYRDGSPLTTVSSYELPSSVVLTNNYVGRSNWSGDAYFEGTIQSVVIYNTAQSTPTCYPVESNYAGNGSIGEDGVSYKVLAFTTVGECSWSVPTGVSQADVVVVGGGGGGGSRSGGGGGAGELVKVGDYPLNIGSVSIEVGAGGNGARNANEAGFTGGESEFKNPSGGAGLKALGGGGGVYNQTPVDSGSGGGILTVGTPSSGASSTQEELDGSATSATSHVSAGAAGAWDNTSNSDFWAGGGGGGAQSAGLQPTPLVSGGLTDASQARGGNGGAGLEISWLPNSLFGTLGIGEQGSTALTLAGGGGGGMGADGVAGGSGGIGGGGSGLLVTALGTSNGLANSGGGGGGSGFDDIPSGTASGPAAADGGSGVVVLRYATAVPVTFDANGGSGSMSTQSVSVGTATNLTTNSFSRTGYTFAGWDTVAGGGGTDYSDQQSVTITNSLTLYAQWNVESYTVTWSSNGGSAITDSTVDYGANLSLPTNPSKAGYHFAGWSATDGGSVVSFPYAHPNTADFTMYAVWERAAYTLSFDNNYSGGSSSTSTYYSGDTLTLPTPTRSGYTLNGWYTASSGGTKLGDSGDTYSPLSSTNLILRYELDDPDSFPGNGTTVTDISSAVNSGVSGAVNAVATNGPTFSTADGMSFSFDGSDDYLLTGDLGTRVSGVSDISLFVWVKPSGNGVIVDELGQEAISPLGATPTGWHDSQIEIVSGQVKFRLWNLDSSEWVVQPISLNEWSYLGITYSAASQTMRAFVNGEQVGEVTSFARSTPEAYSAEGLRYALGAGDSTNMGDGSYGEFTLGSFHVYNAGISEATVLNNYKATCARFVDDCTEQTLYAQWTANDKTVTFASGDEATGSDVTATKYFGVNFTIPNEATSQGYFSRDGYTLTGWATNADGSGTAYEFGDSYSTNADLTLYPVWTINTYSLTFNKGSTSGAEGASQSVTKTHGVDYTLPTSAYANSTFTRTGYTVTGWSTTAAGLAKDYDFGDSYAANADEVLYPYWTINTFAVTYSAGDDGSGSDVSATKTYGTALTLPDSTSANNSFTRTHYTVSAWSENADGSTSDYSLGGSYTANEAVTLYPVWTPNTYTVTYNYNSATGGNSVATSDYVYDGIVVSLPTPTKTGYTFGGWYSNSGLTTSAGAAGASFTTTANVTLYAKWDAATFTVVYEYNGATGGNSASSHNYTTGGTAITLPTPTKPGYTFGGWYSEEALTTSVGAAGASYAPSVNLTVYAKWTAIDYSVTYNSTNSGGGNADAGTVPLDSTSYTIGNTVVVKANTGALSRTGYSFDGWVTNADGSGTALNAGETLTVSTTNINLYPQWSEETYTISYHANGGSGTLTKTSDTYTTNDPNVVLPTTISVSKTGYDFDGWARTPTGTDVGASLSTTSDITLYARWTIKDINYSYLAGSDGDSNSLSGYSFSSFPTDDIDPYGTSITISSSIDQEIDVDSNSVPDHQFGGWSDGSSVYDAGASYLLGASDVNFTAQWIKVFSVRYALAGGSLYGADQLTDSECLGSENTCTDGQTITLNREPTRSGYTFLGWEDQSGSLKSDRSETSISSSSYIFTAQWQANTYSFSFNTLGGSATVTSLSKTIGQTFSMPDPGTKTGYTFGGWRDSSDVLHGVGTTYRVGASADSFTAYWIPDVYSVTYDWQGGTSSSPKASDRYTVGTGEMTLPTASANGYTRDGYTFQGWSTSVGGSVESGYEPSANDVLYAVWADGNYTLSYDGQGGTVGSGLGTVPRTTAVTLPTPVRDSFTFVGWYDAASGGTKIGNGGASYIPTASTALYARWIQDSLYGVDLATLETANTYSASNSTATDTTISHTPSSSSARVQIPAGALPNGTVVTVRYFKDTTRHQDVISDENTYFFSLLVSWLNGSGTSATVPDTALGKPITVTLTNSNIKAGAMVYQVIGETVTELGRAESDGSVTVELTEDPELVVAATKPSAPTGVSGSSADSAASVSWGAATSGGREVTKYTVTASPGGATCETASTSCSVTGLTNNTAYTFTVAATNAIGTSSASSASSAVTPRGSNYTVTFNSNGGSAVSDGSFFSGGSLTAPSSPSRSGYTFQGWSTTQDDESTEVSFPYSPGVLNAITLYALWDVAPASSNSRSSRTPLVTPLLPTRPTVPNSRVVPAPPVAPPAPLTAPVVSPSVNSVLNRPAQVSVGGQLVESETLQQDESVTVTTGRVEIGLAVPTPTPSANPRQNPPSAAPEIRVSAAGVAQLQAKGLLPGSSVQVWLPALDSRELARATVNPDGSVSADVSLRADREQAPIPFGPQVLQVTGVDDEGNLTVVDMTINVTQGDPAPEFNRVENELPDLQPGQSLATNAGVPETVTVATNEEAREVSVVANDWSLRVGIPQDNGELDAASPSAPTIRLIQSRTAEVGGEGFQPGTRVDVFLFSAPTLLGSFTVDSEGSFEAEVFMDERFVAIGDHTLQIQGVGTDGYIKAANLGVLVDEPPAPTTQSVSLAYLWWTVAASLMLVTAVVLVIFRRRYSR